MLRLLLIVFCFFQATGSLPIDFYGVHVSNVYTLVLCAALPVFLRGHSGIPRRLLALALIGSLFAAWQLISVTWSDEVAFSAYRVLVISGYMFLAFALPMAAIAHRIDIVAVYGRVSAWASALLVIYAMTSLPLGARAVYPEIFLPSMTLEALDDFDLNDPNIVACALALGFICGLARTEHRWLRMLRAAVCTMAILLTQSRTAILFLPLSALLAALLTRRFKSAAISLVFLTAIAGVGFSIYTYLGEMGGNSAIVEAFQDRLTSDSGSNEDRLDRLNGALAALGQTKITLLGLGPGGSIFSGLEPHNMFLSFFLEFGILGFILFCGVVALVGRLALGIPDMKQRYYATWSFLFIFFACLTYWHTRTLWFSLSLVLFEALRFPQVAVQRPRLAANGHRMASNGRGRS